MSYTRPESQQPYTPFQPAPRRGGTRVAMIIVAAIAVAAVGVLVAVLADNAGQHGTNAGGPPAFGAARATTSTATTTTTTYERPPYVPKPEDFTLEVQVLEQKCFGSAGCNVTFRIGVAYNGDTIYDGEGPYTVVYSVAGTEDPFVGRFTLLSQYKYSSTEEFVSTPPGATLTATVTQVF